MASTYVRPTITTLRRIEPIETISLDVDSNGQLKSGNYSLSTNGGNLPSDRFMSGLTLIFSGRFTQPSTGNATGILADAPFSLIDTVSLSGRHSVDNYQGPIILAPGPALRELVLEQTKRAPLSLGTLSDSASATSDIKFAIDVPFTPLGIPLAQRIDWLLDNPNWTQLALSLLIGDQTSIFSGQTGYIKATEYGSSSGTPQVEVYGWFAQAGPGQFKGFIPGLCKRYSLGINNSSQLTSSAIATKIWPDVPRGNRIRGLLVRTGVLASSVTAPLSPFSSYSDGIFANIALMRGAKRILREYNDFYGPREMVGMDYGINGSVGFLNIDFCTDQTLGTALDTTNMVQGGSDNTSLFLQADTTGAANQAADALIEELVGAPVSQ